MQALANELVEAQIHFNLYGDLVASHAEYADELSESNTFWSLTLDAHLDATILRLCKAYDQCPTSLNLRNLLDTVSENLDLFEEPNFRERLKENPFVDSLAANVPTPDSSQLQRDIASVNANDPLVKKLVIWRNSYFSHRSRDHALNPSPYVRDYPFTISDIAALLRNGVEVVNRYSNLFCATHYSTNIVGRSDFKSILEAVRETRNRREAEIERQFNQLGLNK